MKVEFHGHHVSASMNASDEAGLLHGYSKHLGSFSLTRVCLFGILSTALSLLSLPVGLFANLCAVFLADTWETDLSRWVVLATVCGGLLLAASFVCSILGLSFYGKAVKGRSNILGFALSLAALAILSIGITLLVFAWL